MSRREFTALATTSVLALVSGCVSICASRTEPQREADQPAAPTPRSPILAAGSFEDLLTTDLHGEPYVYLRVTPEIGFVAFDTQRRMLDSLDDHFHTRTRFVGGRAIGTAALAARFSTRSRDRSWSASSLQFRDFLVERGIVQVSGEVYQPGEPKFVGAVPLDQDPEELRSAVNHELMHIVYLLDLGYLLSVIAWADALPEDARNVLLPDLIRLLGDDYDIGNLPSLINEAQAYLRDGPQLVKLLKAALWSVPSPPDVLAHFFVANDHGMFTGRLRDVTVAFILQQTLLFQTMAQPFLARMFGEPWAMAMAKNVVRDVLTIPALNDHRTEHTVRDVALQPFEQIDATGYAQIPALVDEIAAATSALSRRVDAYRRKRPKHTSDAGPTALTQARRRLEILTRVHDAARVQLGQLNDPAIGRAELNLSVRRGVVIFNILSLKLSADTVISEIEERLAVLEGASRKAERLEAREARTLATWSARPYPTGH